ncbi:MAG: hypothetical protein RLY57_435 [Candidatus Parcubacteria bacterium]|jgi:hypothetical protein
MKKTKALINKLLEEIENTPLVQIACEKIGISRNTFYRWMKEDPGLLEQVNYALSLGKGRVNDIAVSNVLSGIKSKDVRYTMYWLDRNHSDFRKPFVPKVDADDLLVHYRLLMEGSKLRQIEDDIRNTVTTQEREMVEDAYKDANEFMRKWQTVNDNAVEKKARELHEKWKKEEQDKKST